jgi:hypothetical protein
MRLELWQIRFIAPWCATRRKTMSNDRYQEIRDALAMGPTPGPRKWWEQEDFGYCCVNPRDGGLLIAKCDVRDPFDPEQRANAALIAACDPDTIRELLAERDQLAAALEAAREDAERYRHLFDCQEPFCYRGDVFDSKQEADTAIDKARGKAGQEVGDGQ